MKSELTGSPSSNGGFKVLGAILAAFFFIAWIGNSNSGETAPEEDVPAWNPAPALVATDTPAPAVVDPLSTTSARRAEAHLQAATNLEGLAGGRIYSENCYAALTRSFSWAKLDQCGGFDIGAVHLADGGTDGSAADVAYFGSEAAATRYLQAAVSAGAAPELGDERLASLQAAMVRLRGKARPTPALEEASATKEPLEGNLLHGPAIEDDASATSNEVNETPDEQEEPIDQSLFLAIQRSS